MDISHYFNLIKQGNIKLKEFEEILKKIDKLKIQAKKNII